MPSALEHSGHHSSWRQPTGTTTRWFVTSELRREATPPLAKIVAASHDVRVPGYCLGMGSAFDIFHRLAMLAIAYVVTAALVVVDSSSED